MPAPAFTVPSSIVARWKGWGRTFCEVVAAGTDDGVYSTGTPPRRVVWPNAKLPYPPPTSIAHAANEARRRVVREAGLKAHGATFVKLCERPARKSRPTVMNASPNGGPFPHRLECSSWAARLERSGLNERATTRGGYRNCRGRVKGIFGNSDVVCEVSLDVTGMAFSGDAFGGSGR